MSDRLPLPETDGACLAKVRTRLRDSSKPAVQIARFILKSPVQARNMSIGNLAAACEVSTASVSRFSRSLGYKGFKDFQLDLATSVAQAGGVMLEDLSRRATPEAVIRRVFEYNRQSLAETERMLDHKVVIRVSQRLAGCKRVFLVGIGSSAMVAREAAQRLRNLGISAVALEDPYFMIFATEDAARGDVVIGISHTGRTAMVVESIQRAGERGAHTVALTNYPQSALAVASADCLITAHREHRVSAAGSSSGIAQLCVIDALCSILGGWAGTRARRLADEVEKRSQRILRLNA